jgi:hypothetical protein
MEQRSHVAPSSPWGKENREIGEIREENLPLISLISPFST